MALELQGLRSLIHPVEDVDAAKAWWAELLGFGPYFDEPTYVGFEVAGYELGLFPGGDPADGAIVYWGVDDPDAAIAAAVGLGATEHTPVTDVGNGIRMGDVRTPQGSIVGFIHNPHFQLP